MWLGSPEMEKVFQEKALQDPPYGKIPHYEVLVKDAEDYLISQGYSLANIDLHKRCRLQDGRYEGSIHHDKGDGVFLTKIVYRLTPVTSYLKMYLHHTQWQGVKATGSYEYQRCPGYITDVVIPPLQVRMTPIDVSCIALLVGVQHIGLQYMYSSLECRLLGQRKDT
jgi:hypothetical protein